MRATTLLLSVIALLCSACAARQAIPVRCVTHPVEIYVDGRLLEGTPALLELDTNEPHKVFVKAEGYEPQLYTFEPVLDAEGASIFERKDLCIELVPVGQGRVLEVEVDD